MENPMLSEDILRRFFELCELSDLSRFRLVCRQWAHLSLRRWRREKVVHIYQSFPFKMTRRDEERVRTLCSTRSSELVVEQDEPYKSFVLHELTLSTEPERVLLLPWIPPKLRRSCNSKREPPLMERFWKLCGSSMTRLRLTNCVVHSVQLFRKVIFLPNLEELALEGIRFAAETQRQVDNNAMPISEQPHLKILELSKIEDWEPLQLSWQLLLAAFPNTQSLRLGCSSEQIEALIVALDLIHGSIKNLEIDLSWPKMKKPLKFSQLQKSYPPLENIMFRMVDDEEIWSLRKLAQHPKLKLDSFRLRLSDVTKVTNLLVNLVLEIHGSTLQSLTLDRDYYKVVPLSGFCLDPLPLHNLTELELIGEFYENFHLLEEAPHLTALRVSQVSVGEKLLSESVAEGMLRSVTRLSSLRLFHFGWTQSPTSQVSRGWAEVFVEVMPNVRELKAPLSSAAFQVVCEKWRELRSLTLLSSSWMMDDGTLTGRVEGREELELLPNITDLKYLQVLQIDSGKLTDDAVYNGLLRAPSLHSLTVTLSHEASNDAFLQLFNEFSGGRVSREVIPHSVPEKTRKMKKELNKELWKRWSRRGCGLQTSPTSSVFNNNCRMY